MFMCEGVPKDGGLHNLFIVLPHLGLCPGSPISQSVNVEEAHTGVYEGVYSTVGIRQIQILG